MYKDDIGYFLNRYKAGEAKKYLQQAIPLLIDVGNYDEVIDIIDEAIKRMSKDG